MEAVHRRALHLEEFNSFESLDPCYQDSSVPKEKSGRRYRRKMKSIRSWLRFRPVIPAIIGLSLGFALSMLYIPIVEQQCLYDLEESQIYLMNSRRIKLPQSKGKTHDPIVSDVKSERVVHTTVTPKPSHFNDGLRPFYIASELGKREKLLVGVLTSEDHLDSLVLAINNTWAPELPKVVFFVPYSRDPEFHEKYSKVLGIPVVQLDVDSEEDMAPQLKLSFKMLKYMYEHYFSTYEWFLRVEDNVYLKPEKLMEFINSANSSKSSYIGRPAAASFTSTSERFNVNEETSFYTQEKYCLGRTGVILSRTVLQRLAPFLEGCLEDALSERDDKELGRCLYNNLGVQCTWAYEYLSNKNMHILCSVIEHSGFDQSTREVLGEAQHEVECFLTLLNYSGQTPSALLLNIAQRASEMFFEIPKEKRKDVLSLIKERHALHAIMFYPINDPMVMYHIHRYFTELELNRTFVETRMLQTAIKDILPLLPEGVPEKHPAWPIGFRQPFRPTSRFEVIQWEYFNNNVTYGSTEVKPQVELKGPFKQDVNEVIHTAVRMLTHEEPQKTACLINGYRRVDPRRGAEYILDMKVKAPTGKDERRRVYMLRPFTKVESIQMTATTEQRGIHLVLPVLKGEIEKLEQFLKMYQRVCLQSGENVVLLTVFVNVREDSDGGQVQDRFADGKTLIARYKQKYTWAQFPWIQIGVQYNSLSLLMDIVTMKLPSNALIFLTSLGVEFTINFLNRCRVNALSGQQVFLPIPFSYYDPDVAYRHLKVPDEIPLTRDSGHWDTDIYSLACFNNKDYKNNRINSEDFLKETEFRTQDFVKIFVKSNLQVFRAVDVDLRKKYDVKTCKNTDQADSVCLEKKAEAMGSRSQLALLLFGKEKEKERRRGDGNVINK